MNTRLAGSHIKSLSAHYHNDGSTILKSYKNTTSEGYSLYSDAIFSNLIDAQINNYSGIYLTSRNLGSNFFELENLHQEYPFSINSQLKSGDIILTINPDQSYSFTFDSSPDANINRTYFEVEFIDSVLLRIGHSAQSKKYLSLVEYDFFPYYTFAFKEGSETPSISGADVFYYIYDDESESLALFKNIPDLVLLTFRPDGIYTRPVSGESIFDSSSLLSINNYRQFSKPKFNTSWVSYNPTNPNNFIVDHSKSRKDIPTNYLIHGEYYNIHGNTLPINFLNLKNTYTHKNNSYRSSYMENDPNPVVSREYKTIFSGNNQERGNQEIILGYEFYETDYEFKADGYTIFYTPESMYPFDNLNINDTLLVKTGAIGGDSPYTSDKVLWKRTDPKDNLLLCSWLSAGDTENLWVDRYYNPKESTYLEALTALSNFVDPASALLGDAPFYDISSQLIFKPNEEYIYFRIGNEYVNTIINAVSATLLDSDPKMINALGRDITPDTLNAEQYTILKDYNDLNKTSQYTIGFSLQSMNWQGFHGHTIISNMVHNGFEWVLDPLITPLIQIQNGNDLEIFNTDFLKISTIKTTGPIKDLYREDVNSPGAMITI